jgi:catecholate siderophore receptor
MPTIRGFSSTNDIQVDGIRSALRTEYEIFNIETVEINKGPGGTIAGTGSTGGTVNLTSKVPLEGNFNNATLTYGTGAYKRTTLDSNRDFGDFSARLNLMYQEADSLYGRDGRTSERYGVAPSFSYKLSEQTKITAGLYYYKNKDALDYGVPLSNANTPSQYKRGSGSSSDPFEAVDVPTDSYYGINDRDFHDAEDKSAYVRLDHEISSSLRLSTTLRKTESSNAYVVAVPSSTGTGVTRTSRSSNRDSDDLAFNTQLTGEALLFGLKHKFGFGADVSNSQVNVKSLTVTNASGFDSTTSYTDPDTGVDWNGTITQGGRTSYTAYQNRGIYAFDVVEIAPKWEASFGLRYDSYKATTTTTSTGAVVQNDSSFWNANFGLVYELTDNGRIYGSIGSSSNPAGEGNGIGTNNTTSLNDLDPERSYNYELGTKWLLFNDQLAINAAIYRVVKDNARVTDEDGFTENIGKTVSKGLDLDIAGKITDAWSVSLGYAYLNAKIVNGGYSNGLPSTSNGTQVVGTPKHSISLWSTYALNDRLTLGGGAIYTDRRNLNAAGTAIIPSQVRVDLMAAYNFNETTAVQINANNIFDEQLYSGNRGTGFVNVEPGRNFAVTLKHSF